MPEGTNKVSEDEHWRIDKRIPIAFILVMVVQAAGIIWWAATTEGRLGVLEETDASRAMNSERLVELETRLASTNEAIIAMGQAVIRNSERISSAEGNRFTEADGIALESRVNDRIDDSFDRLQELIRLLREDIRLLNNQEHSRDNGDG